MSDSSLGTRLSDSVREAAGDQAKAYAKYASLLDRFAKRDIDYLDFGRNALDIYADAVRDITQIGGRAANDTIKTGIGKARSFNFSIVKKEGSSGPVIDAKAAIGAKPVVDAKVIAPGLKGRPNT